MLLRKRIKTNDKIKMTQSNDEIIGKIYGSATDPSGWLELMESITQWTHPHHTESPNLASLLAHLERATHSNDYIFALEAQQNSLDSLHKTMPWPLLMLDSKMQVLDTNPAADVLLGQHAPISINADGTLKFKDQTLHAALQGALSNATLATGTGKQILNSTTDQLSLLYSITAQPETGGAYCPAIVWVLSGEHKIVPTVDIIQTIFGLTAAEAKLLHALCRHGNLNDCAKILAVSVHTVRSQLKSIMAKTHINSQVQLVAHVMGYAFLQTAVSNVYCAQEQRILLPDGRVLTWFEYGTAHGRPVLALEDLGAGAPHHASFHQWYKQNNLRVILVIRPGYGASTVNPNIQFANFAEDLKYLCTALQLQKPTIATFCVGGAYALCAAATHTELFDRVGVLATTVPIEYFELHKLDWIHTLLLRMYKTDPRLFAMFARLALRGVKRDPKKYFARSAKLLGNRDEELLTDPNILERTIQQVQLRHCQGAEIVVTEYMLVMQSWQVDLAKIQVPVLMWHGENDPTVSIGSACALAQQIPGVVFKQLPEHGHFLVHDIWTDFLEALLEIPGNDGSTRK
jgi:pimeloyl-ACP methyl ester carboxylesterase/DNA-binding CsgD family transcriptional regulator